MTKLRFPYTCDPFISRDVPKWKFDCIYCHRPLSREVNYSCLTLVKGGHIVVYVTAPLRYRQKQILRFWWLSCEGCNELLGIQFLPNLDVLNSVCFIALVVWAF